MTIPILITRDVPFFNAMDVFVDGERLSDCVAANVHAGMAWVARRDDSGCHIPDPDNPFGVATRQVLGAVEVKIGTTVVVKTRWRVPGWLRPARRAPE